jgi:hypothetical protein
MLNQALIITRFLQFACMDQLLRASDDSLDSILASLPLTDSRKKSLLPEIAKWRRDPLNAIAFMSSIAAANAAAPSRCTVTARATMVIVALNRFLNCAAHLSFVATRPLRCAEQTCGIFLFARACQGRCSSRSFRLPSF